MRRLLIASAALAVLGGAGFMAYDQLLRGEPPPESPVHNSNGPIVTQEEFDHLAQTDPVKLLDQCLTRYEREVKGGMHATLVKQERVKGEPKDPKALPPEEVIDLWVRGDVEAPATKKTAIEVLMKWKAEPRSFLGSAIRGTLFSEKSKAEGGLDGQVTTWRPEASFKKLTTVDANNSLAKGMSRYCIRDAGLYRTMLRTHQAWKSRQDAGTLKFEYKGTQTHPRIGRECHVIKRVCEAAEVDDFELRKDEGVGGTPAPGPGVAAKEGFTEVTIYIDAERWIQAGTELYRTEPDGTPEGRRVLVGAYYFRDVELNPTIPPDTFTQETLKK